MNGIEKITERIEQDAQARIDVILADANAKANEITAKYDAQAQKEASEIVSRGEKNAAERGERLESMAQMEAKKLSLAAKQQMLDKAFDLALEQLSNLPEEQYVELLAKLAAKASSNGKEAIMLSEKDRAQFGDKIVAAANAKISGGALTLCERTRQMCGGLILVDGDVEVNCAFETLVRLQRGSISAEVAKVLFD